MVQVISDCMMQVILGCSAVDCSASASFHQQVLKHKSVKSLVLLIILIIIIIIINSYTVLPALMMMMMTIIIIIYV